MTSSLNSDNSLQACFALFELHDMFYTAGEQFLFALKITGLAYPESVDLSHPIINPLVVQTETFYRLHRPIVDPDFFTRYPDTAIEEPSHTASYPYTFGQTPSVILQGSAS